MSTVIKVENLSKEYHLGTIDHGVLYKDLQSWWSRLRGKEDPNARLDQKSRVDKDSFLALNDVSFEVKQGEAVGIIGRNGAGKSTLLKILSRVTTPTKGSVKVKGRVASLLEVGTGFHPELTGRENIYLNGAILGMSKREIANRIDEIIDFSGVETHIDTPVKRYSSGMYVRLAFAVAAHLEPEILIVDEVLAVGDFEFQKKCLGKMKDVGEEGRTVIFVSHNMGAISTLCEKVILLHEGKNQKIGNSSNVISTYVNYGKKTIGNNAVCRFEPTEKHNVQIIGAMLQNSEATNQNLFLIGEKVYLCINYEIRKPISGIGIQVEVSLNGQILFVSVDTDGFDDVVFLRDAGEYQSRLEIANHLKVGIYKISKIWVNRLEDTLDNEFMTRDIKIDVFEFEIRDNPNITRGRSFVSKAPGLMMHKEPWVIENMNKID